MTTEVVKYLNLFEYLFRDHFHREDEPQTNKQTKQYTKNIFTVKEEDFFSLRVTIVDKAVAGDFYLWSRHPLFMVLL